MKRYFEISCHALIGTAFFALALTGRLDAISILMFTLGFGVSLQRSIQGKPPLLTAKGAFYLSCAYIGIFLFDLVFISRALIGGTVHLVLFSELAKLHQEKADKDYLYLILLAFVKILAASSLTVDISFVATLLLFLTALVSTLISFDIYRSERDSRISTGQAAKALGGMSVGATLWIIVLGAALFFAIPRFGVGYFTRAVTSPLLISGFNDNVSLGQIGQLKLSSAIVMHAKRLNNTPLAVLKWRGITLDTFNGKNWSKKVRGRSFVPATEGVYNLGNSPVEGQLVSYDILLEPLATTTLFGPYRVREVSGRLLPGIEVDDSGGIYTRFQQSRRMQYRVESEIASRPLASQPTTPGEAELTDAAAETYLQLPVRIDPRVQNLAQQIIRNAKTPLDKAIRVEAYLKRNFKYTLTLNWTPGPEPVSTFLFDAKSGHCEYFASAMAVLLRSAGIPTRIVNGFLMGEYNPVGDAYIVRQSDAHSWVEVFLPGTGWTEFDPTPADANQPDTGLIAQLGNYADAVGLFWNTYILTYDTDSQMQLFRSAQETAQGLQKSMQERTEHWALSTQDFADNFAARVRLMAHSGWTWSVAGLAAALLLFYRNRLELWTRWQLLDPGRGSGVADERLVAALFYRAVRLAERETPKRKSSQTWREWLGTVPQAERRSVLAQALEVFERSRYGREATSSEDFARLQQAVRDLRGLLQ